MIYCVLVPKTVNNPSNNFLTVKNNSNSDGESVYENLGNIINANDIVQWTSTKLELSAPFSVANCQIGVEPTSGVVVDTADSVILAPINTAVTLKATADFNVAYKPYVQYTWYKDGQVVQQGSSDTYEVAAAEATGINHYACEVNLVSGESISQPAKSNQYTLNVVTSTQLTANTASSSVTGVPSDTSLTAIPAGNTVNLSATFNLGGQALDPNSQNYTVSYTWFNNGNVVNIPTANTNKLVLEHAQTNQSGSYVCEATVNFSEGGKISVKSSPISITIIKPDTISLSTNLTPTLKVANGDKAVFTVNAILQSQTKQDQSKTLVYQWEYLAPNQTAWTKVNDNNKNTLELNSQQTVDANGYQFRCLVSCNNPVAQIEPIYSQASTLDVINPELSVVAAITSPTTALKYGENVTLTATPTVTNQADVVTSDGFEYAYKYEWFVKNSGSSDWNPVNENVNSATLQITNLTAQNDGSEYRCLVTISNALTPTVAKPQNKTVTVTEPQYSKYSNVVSLNITKFKADVNATVTSVTGSQVPTPSDKIVNNLGDKFNLTANVEATNGYPSLPSGYHYVYQWLESTSMDTSTDSTWNPIPIAKSATANSNTLEVQSTDAGAHYYRCQVTIAEDADTEADPSVVNKATKVIPTQSPVFYSSLVTVQTYPSLTLTANQTAVTLAHNASTVLTPNIQINTSLTPGLSTPKVVAENNDNLGLCHPTYQWSFKSSDPSGSSMVAITPDNAHEYPFISGNSYSTGSLEINSLNSDQCNGEYSLTVTINSKDYSLQTPYTVTENPATFTVEASASAQLGKKLITLTANTQPISNSQSTEGTDHSEDQGTEQPVHESKVTRNAPETEPSTISYTYKWYMKDPENPSKYVLVSDPNEESKSTQKIEMPKPVEQSWSQKLEFYCAVTNNETGEVEWNSSISKLTVEEPTLTDFSITGSGNVNYNRTVTLKAEASNPNFVVDGRNVTYQWQYSTNGMDWKNINDGDNVTITSLSGGGSQLQLLHSAASWNGLKIQCVASYGNGISKNSTNQITINLQTQELKSATTDNLVKFANTIVSEFSSSNLANTLTQLGVSKNGLEFNGVPSTVSTTWLNEILGLDKTKIDYDVAFGGNDTPIVELSAYPNPVKPTVEHATYAEVESGTSESLTYKTMLKFKFNAINGYTWPTNLATPTGLSAPGSGSSYVAQLANNNQSLVLWIPVDLSPSFVLTPSSSTSLQLSSSSNSLSATVTASGRVTSYTWYAVTSDGVSVALTQNNQPTVEFKTIFGENAQYTITRSDTSANQCTLSITNISTQNNPKLNNLKLYALGTLSASGSYWQQYPCLTPFTVTCQTASMVSGQPK